jgi:hypothetical protein
MVDRGWAGRLLEWRWRGVWLEAEISRCRYHVRAVSGEVLAHAEVRDVDGRRRIEIGSFPNVSAAREACEADAQRRVRRDRESAGV